jgi:hypothetical protein
MNIIFTVKLLLLKYFKILMKIKENFIQDNYSYQDISK